MKEVLDNDLQKFIKNILPEPDLLLTQIVDYAKVNHISIVEPEVGNLLNLLVRLLQPEKILEIGTAIGCSAIYMARALAENGFGHITTIELVSERAEMAKKYFAQAGLQEYIELINADARALFPTLEGPYDVVFLDAAKGQYEDFLQLAYDKLKPNGVVIADNVLLNGWVVNLAYPNHRKKTFVYRMKNLLESFREREDYQCSLIPLGDGVAIFRKKEK